jgi:predicted nucleic acid-binding protein
VIVADTNVLSEPLRPRPEPRVLSWLAEHSDELAITTITVGELLYGARRLPPGKRRNALISAIESLIASAADRILPYDEQAAQHYAALRARREAVGRSVSVEDTMIAAICLAGGHDIATRNNRDFEDAAIIIHNPWEQD